MGFGVADSSSAYPKRIVDLPGFASPYLAETFFPIFFNEVAALRQSPPDIYTSILLPNFRRLLAIS